MTDTVWNSNTTPNASLRMTSYLQFLTTLNSLYSVDVPTALIHAVP